MTLQQDIDNSTDIHNTATKARGALENVWVAKNEKTEVQEKDLEAIAKAIELLYTYVRIGSPQDTLKAFKAAMILDDFTVKQPKPIKEAWDAHLKHQGAR